MLVKFNQMLDYLSEFLAHRKGLLPLVGILLVITNMILQFTTISGWFIESDLLLHLGVILAILGIMLAWAL